MVLDNDKKISLCQKLERLLRGKVEKFLENKLSRESEFFNDLRLAKNKTISSYMIKFWRINVIPVSQKLNFKERKNGFKEILFEFA